MVSLLRLGLTVFVLVLAACSGRADSLNEEQVLHAGSLGEEQVLHAAWESLKPNTSSHDRANWEVVELRQVAGREVAEQFDDEPAPSCPGPAPPANGTSRGSGAYWYVELKPRLATPVPQEGTISPTAPPVIPEPFARRALFLIDTADGRVVARKIFCVVY